MHRRPTSSKNSQPSLVKREPHFLITFRVHCSRSSRLPFTSCRVMRALDCFRTTGRAGVPRVGGRFGRVIAPLLLAVIGVACDSQNRDPLDEIRKLQSEGQIEQSIVLLQDLVEGGDRRGEVLYRYGRGLSGLGDAGRAVWPLDAAISDPKWAFRAAMELAFNANQTENYEFALKTLARLREMQSAEERDKDVGPRLLEAYAHIGTRRNYGKALETLEEALTIDPDNEEGLRLKGVALLGLHRTDEAYALIRSAGAEPEEVDAADSSSSRDLAYWCSIESSFQRESGDIAKAEEVLEECLERYPTSIALLDEAINVYAVQGKAEEALAVLKTAYDAAPDNREFRMPYVAQLGAMHRTKEAEEVFRADLERQRKKEHPDSAELGTTLVDLAVLLVGQERFDAALDAYAEATSILGSSAAPDLLFSQAETMIRVGRYDDALKIAEETPVEVYGPMIRGRVAFERGDFAKALEELSQAAVLWPNSGPLRYYLARTAEGLGEFDRAIEEYRQALRSDKDLDAARVRLAKLHLAEGRAIQAKAIAMSAPTFGQPQMSVDLKLVEIEIQARTGNTVELGDIPSDPKRSDETVSELAARSVSRGLRARVGAEKSAELLVELQESFAGRFASILFRERIESLLADGRVEDAVALCRAAVARQKSDVYARISLARALGQKSSSLDEAKALLSEAVSERPKDAETMAWLGEIEGKLGQTTRAVEHFEAALSIEPENADAMIGLTRALVTLARRPEAVSRLERFLSRDNPTEGRVALELAKLLGEEDAAKSRRIALGRRAIRFGAGQPATDFLRSIDPELVRLNETES